MDTATIDRLRTRLEQERDRDQARLEELDGHPAGGSAHTMEQGEAGAAHRPKATRQQEEQASLREETERRLGDIDRALERIDQGTYDTCEVCEGQIAEERLDAVPMTRRCREHAVSDADLPH